MTAVHSTLPPSSAHIWAPPEGCPGWMSMQRHYPDTERSDAAEEGTAAHEVAAAMIRAACRCGVGFPREETTIGTQASNGVIITEEIYDGATVFHDIILKTLHQNRIFGGPNMGIERRVAAPSYIHPNLFGTPDFFLYNTEALKLYVYDLKFGFGRVYAFENWQLISYAAAILETLGLQNPNIEVSLNIVQPRGFWFDGPDQWTLKLEQLGGYIRQAQAGAARAYAPGAPVHSGLHCRYCRARHDCPAAIAAGLQYIEATTEQVPLDLGVAQQAVLYRQILRAQRHLKALEAGLEEVLKNAAQSGTQIPGFRLEPATGFQTWSRPNKEVFVLGQMMGIPLESPAKPITPIEAKKRGLDPKLVDAYSNRPVKGTKLVEDDGTLARKVFQ